MNTRRPLNLVTLATIAGLLSLGAAPLAVSDEEIEEYRRRHRVPPPESAPPPSPPADPIPLPNEFTKSPSRHAYVAPPPPDYRPTVNTSREQSRRMKQAARAAKKAAG